MCIDFSMREGDPAFLNDVDIPLEVPYVLFLYFFQLVTVSSESQLSFLMYMNFSVGEGDLTFINGVDLPREVLYVIF